MKEARHEVGEKTRAEFAAMVVNYLSPLFASRDPRELSAKDIKAGIRDVQGKFRKPLTSATKYKLIHVMSLIMQCLAEDKVIPANQLLRVQPHSKAPEAPRGALPNEILAKLFPSWHGPLIKVWGKTFLATLTYVMYDSGMRPIELQHLRWGGYPHQGKDRHYQKTKVPPKNQRWPGGGIIRAVRLSEKTIHELEIRKAETAFPAPGDLVFTLYGQAAVTDPAIVEAMRRGLRGIKEFRQEWTPYGLCHSFFTYAMADLTPQEVAGLAEHSLAIAEVTYSHPDDEVILKRTSEARGKLDKLTTSSAGKVSTASPKKGDILQIISRGFNMVMKDRDIRYKLREKHLAHFYADSNSLVVEEFSLMDQDARIDIAVINGALHGYEIKSDADNLERLPKQIEAYSRIFDYLWVVCGEKHLEKVTTLVPENWGIIQASGMAKLELREIRNPTRNYNNNSYYIARLLWKPECIKLLNECGVRKGLSSKRLAELCNTLAGLLPQEELSARVRQTIRQRQSWRVVKPQTPCVGSSQFGPRSKHSREKNLAHFLSQI